ncbi:MAG: TrmB family transcriptional regulator [Haloferacaceae archaeon]
MSSQRPPSESTPLDPLPDRLDSARTKLVYLYVRRRPGATVDELQSALDMSALTVYPVLSSLEASDLVRRTDDGYRPVPTDGSAAR